MAGPSDNNPLRPRRKLNQPLIKSIIVLVAALCTAVGSAVTGIGAHVAFAPMLTWMFGYHPEKALGTAFRFTLFASVAAIITTLALHGNAPVHLLRGILLMIGATAGALLSTPFTPNARAIGARRALQGLGIIAAVFTITEASHLSMFSRSGAHYAYWDAWWQMLLLGLVVGAITQAARLPGGTLLVPAVFFLTALPDRALGGALRPVTAGEAVVEALIVVFLASLLPAWGYTQRGLVDSTYLPAAIMGGVVGGILGGWLLTLLLERSILIFFGIVAMFFAGREIARLATVTPEALPPETPPNVSP